MRFSINLPALLAALCVTAAPLEARVLRVEVLSRQDVLGSRTFGAAGAYERLAGRVYFSVRPDNPHNQRIVDASHTILRAEEAFQPPDA